MSDYYVGPSADYESPQTAIDQLKVDAGVLDFTEQHSIIITDGSAYDSYTVAGLNPTSTYRLLITAATSAMPTILSKAGDIIVSTPITIESPYVTLERHEARGGTFGVMVGDQADGFTARQMMVRDPVHAGIITRGSDEIVIYNTVIYAPNTCVVARRVKKFGMFYCTLKNGMPAAFNSTVPANNDDPYPQASALFIDKAEGDTETVYIRNNNMVAVNGPVIATNERLARYLNADYNNYFSPQGQVAHFLPIYGKKAMNIEGWRRATDQEDNSLSEDPRFRQGQVQGDLEDGILQDLKLKKASKLRAQAEDSSSYSLPAYVPHADFTGDFDDVVRTTPNATPGAYELVGSVYNYWDQIFPQGRSDPHGDTPGIWEIAKEHYGDVVKPWYPKVNTGFFWARDNLFYLYSDKQASVLDQMRWYKFDFTGDVLEAGAVVVFDGQTLTTDQWNIRGDKMIFKSAGFSVTGDNMILSFSGEQLNWDTGEIAFTTGDHTWQDTIGNAEAVYVIDPPPLNGAPVVVTDDSILSSSPTGDMPYGYEVSYDDDLSQVVVAFQAGKLADPTLVTLEWEGSDTGVYEIEDLTVNPIQNPKTDGFLSIRNVRAAQWDRTLPSGESTLTDDWFAGRTGDILPWAKVNGKNKWHPLIRENPAPVPRESAYSHPTGECWVIDSVPGPLVALQGTTGEEVLFTFMDREENPWAFEMTSYVLSTSDSDPTGEFPGYLAKRQFGLYTRLGQSLSDVETDHAGNVAIRYIPPPGDMVSLYDPNLVASSYVETTYDVYPDNYGNPTARDELNVEIPLTGELAAEIVTGELTGGYYYYTLSSYPTRGTVSVSKGGVRQELVYSPAVQDGQAYVDIESKQVKSKVGGTLDISFRPALIWRDPTQPRRLYLSPSLSLPTYHVIGYDAWIKLTGSANGVSQIHDIVCRNPYDTGEF